MGDVGCRGVPNVALEVAPHVTVNALKISGEADIVKVHIVFIKCPYGRDKVKSGFSAHLIRN